MTSSNPLPASSNGSNLPAATLDDWRHSQSAVGWRYYYLVARQAVDDEKTAAARARVSPAIVYREVEINPDFARLRQLAIDRRLALGNEDSSRIARESFPAIAAYAAERVTTPTVRDRDQVAWANLVGNAAGALRPQDGDAPTGQIAAVLAKLDLTVRVASAVPSTPPPIGSPTAPGPITLDVPSRSSEGTPDADTGAS